jgi:hypothetical protein
MNLTISLDELLAEQLRREATARRLAPEQLARDLRCRALGKIEEEQAWQPVQQRRAELIRKSRAHGLTAEEGKELTRVQAAIDQGLESSRSPSAT